jgi:hypothetical protein
MICLLVMAAFTAYCVAVTADREINIQKSISDLEKEVATMRAKLDSQPPAETDFLLLPKGNYHTKAVLDASTFQALVIRDDDNVEYVARLMPEVYLKNGCSFVSNRDIGFVSAESPKP